MARNSSPSHHVNPRVRAFGKARLDIARRARTRQEWDTLWKRPQYHFPFRWGSHWKQCIEYRVDDFAAEVGFFIDILGLPVNAFNEYFAMFTGPEQEFYFAVTPTFEDQESTSPDALRLQFFVEDIFEVCNELAQRGVEFEQPPQPVAEGSSYYVGYFLTPHGIPIDVCGLVNLDDLEISLPEQPSDKVDEPVEDETDVEDFPEEESLPPSPRLPNNTFVEVRSQPSPARSPFERPVTPPLSNKPANLQTTPPSHNQLPRQLPQSKPAAPPSEPQQRSFTPSYQPPPPPSSEPIYEDVQDDEEEA